MSNEDKQNRPVYEQPGILDPDRNVPNSKEPDLKIVTHYNDDDGAYPDTRTSFTDTSANAMEPMEDLAFLRGEVRPKTAGGGDTAKIRPNILPNSDPMAGGALPEHSKTAYKAGNPSFFTDPLKLAALTMLMLLVIIGEVLLLIWLIK